ncbi:putative RNA-directed DNA polymerase from transposon X-element [Trichonephila clavipes]|nr:putative RNA-directed DNA polymerase from transposon X-element [Trichonephila clavipes]
MWNCPNNSIRGCQLKTFVDILDLSIAFPDTPTRYGYRSANTIDFAIIINFHFPYNINSLAELSSDHNPVILNFSLLPPIHHDNARAVTTCWSAFKSNLKNNIKILDFKGIKNPTVLEEKIDFFTTAVRSAHQFASKPIVNTNHAFTPNFIRNLIRDKNRAKKLYHNTLNPTHKQNYYRFNIYILDMGWRLASRAICPVIAPKAPKKTTTDYRKSLKRNLKRSHNKTGITN